MRSLWNDACLAWPHLSLLEEWQQGGSYKTGSTEPWTQQVVAALLAATWSQSVLELGCYTGTTSIWLCQTLQRMGGGTYTGVEIEYERQKATIERLSALHLPDVEWKVLNADSLSVLRTLPARSIDFAWVDDDHTPSHVADELELLCRPTLRESAVMAPGGLITMHDVYGDGSMPGLAGACAGYHGFSLNFPRLGALGGLGLIQVP